MHRNVQLGRALHLLPVLVLLWYALAGGTGWAFGLAAACLVAALVLWLVPAAPVALSSRGIVRFVGYFLYRSLLGGLDVAWRALDPRLPLDTRETFYPLQFSTPQERTLFMGVLSLLPGTLSCDLVNGRLLVHSISGNPSAELERLDARVRAVFRSAPPADPGIAA